MYQKYLSKFQQPKGRRSGLRELRAGGLQTGQGPLHVGGGAVLYCTVLYCNVIYCTVLYYNVLYCNVQVLLSMPDCDEVDFTMKEYNKVSLKMCNTEKIF